MPVMDGYEATRRIKQSIKDKKYPKMKIVAVTAYAFNEKVKEVYEAGMDDYLPKPINVSAVKGTLKKYLTK